jgi:hypothetical protein
MIIDDTLPGGKGLAITEVDMPSDVGYELSKKATKAGFAPVYQAKIAKETITNNLSDEKIKASGMSVEALWSLIQGGGPENDSIAASARDKYLKEYRQLESKGIDLDELRSRYEARLKTERELIEDPRIATSDALLGGLVGYITDPVNASVNLAGVLATISRKALTLGGRVVAGAVENMAIEMGLMSAVDNTVEEKAKAVGIAGAVGGALPVIGAGVRAAFTKKAAAALNTNNARTMAKGLREIVKDAPSNEAKEMIGRTAEKLERLGGRSDQAFNIIAELETNLAKRSPKNQRLAEQFYVEMGSTKIIGRTQQELFDNLRSTLARSEFSEEMVEELIEDLRVQPLVGEFDTYRIVNRASSGRKQSYVDLQGNKKTLQVKSKPMIYNTAEEASKGLKKANLDFEAEVVQMNNGKYAVVTGSDTVEPLGGTRGFPTKEAAEKELLEYAHRYGIDPEELTTDVRPSFSDKYDVDHVVVHRTPVRKPRLREDGTVTALDNLTMKKEKIVEESVDNEMTQRVRSLIKQPDQSLPEVSKGLDQSILDRRTAELDKSLFKKFNAAHKEKVDIFEQLKECI